MGHVCPQRLWATDVCLYWPYQNLLSLGMYIDIGSSTLITRLSGGICCLSVTTAAWPEQSQSTLYVELCREPLNSKRLPVAGAGESAAKPYCRSASPVSALELKLKPIDFALYAHCIIHCSSAACSQDIKRPPKS